MVLAFICSASVTMILLAFSKRRYGRIWWSLALPLVTTVVLHAADATEFVRSVGYISAIVAVVVIRWLAAWRRGVKTNTST